MNLTTRNKVGIQPAVTPVRGEFLQRKCDCGQHTIAGGSCESCRNNNEPNLQRSAINHDSESANGNRIPSIVHEVLRSPGQPLDAATRGFMEPRFGHDFSQVRVHTDATATESARAVDAMAYTVGRNIAFGPGNYQPSSSGGLRLLAHELTHVVQQQGGPGVHQAQGLGRDDSGEEQEADRVADQVVSKTSSAKTQRVGSCSSSRGVIQPYRRKGSFNFGISDTATLKEESFKDPKTQPWVNQITIKFDATTIDTNGHLVPTGTLTATYDAAALSDITLPMSGGSAFIGLSDKVTGSKIHRIEGDGYNDLPLSAAEGEGPNRKYAKSLAASMRFAMFFKGKQAIHLGRLDLGSHACVHAGSNATALQKMRQLNYHSVEGRTKVDVDYDTGILKDLCCARMKHLGVKKKGGAPNPCNNADPKACPP